MKKTITSIAVALVMVSSFSSFATEKANPLKNIESTKVVSIYMDATTLGNIELNKFLFADDFEYKNMANGDSFNKKEYTSFLKGQKGVKFDCKTSYEIMDQNNQACIAKMTMQFDNFTRVDYITLNQIDGSWKISEVVTNYVK